MATRPAIIEGISTQHHSPFHRARHDTTCTHRHTKPCCYWTHRRDRQKDKAQTGQEQEQSNRSVQHRPNPRLGPNSTRLDSAHDTTGERVARTGRSSQVFFYFSALLDSDSVWALRPQFSVRGPLSSIPSPVLVPVLARRER